MANSKTSSVGSSLKIPKWLILAFLIVSFIGFLDAVYLTITHYTGLYLNCFIKGCETALASQYAAIGNIPVALLGAIYYIVIFIFVIAYLDTKKEFFINFVAWLTIIGLFVSFWFLFVQFFIIKEICLYCLVSAGASILLFIFMKNLTLPKIYSTIK